MKVKECQTHIYEIGEQMYEEYMAKNKMGLQNY